jgi:hypothetical protein
VFASIDYTDDSFVQAFRRGIRGVRDTALLIIILKYEGTVEGRIMEIVDRKSYDHFKINPDLAPLALRLL